MSPARRKMSSANDSFIGERCRPSSSFVRASHRTLFPSLLPLHTVYFPHHHSQPPRALAMITCLKPRCLAPHAPLISSFKVQCVLHRVVQERHSACNTYHALFKSLPPGTTASCPSVVAAFVVRSFVSIVCAPGLLTTSISTS